MAAGLGAHGMRRGFAALLGVVLLLEPVVSLAAGQRRSRTGVRVAKAKRTPAPPARKPAYGTRGTLEEHVHIRRGDTLAGILAARDVPARDAKQWIAAAAVVHDPRRLQPRRGLTLRFDRATHALVAILYEIDDRSLLLVRRTENGVRAERSALPYFTEVKGVAMRIERGLLPDATGAGVPASVVSELAEVFGWEVDLAAQLHPGDQFRLLYENIWQTGAARAEPGKVLGAEITTRRGAVTAVYFEDTDGRGGYYRPNGDPLTREFLRYPVEFTEITSEFSLLRRHPITRRPRPHLGVDFAAPVGTPVRAVATGTVNQSERVPYLGIMVRIDHGGTLTSLYGHLSEIAAGVREGVRVERGQVIGYVGASGLATGPHLHFAVHRDGTYVNPLALTSAPAERIAGPVRPAFERVKVAVTRELAKLPVTARPVTVSLAAAAGARTE